MERGSRRSAVRAPVSPPGVEGVTTFVSEVVAEAAVAAQDRARLGGEAADGRGHLLVHAAALVEVAPPT